MELKVKGIIENFLEIKKGTSEKGNWINQEFLVKTDENYNNLYCFSVFGQEKVENLTKYNKVGQEVEVFFNVNCREFDGRYFTSLSAWKIFSVKEQDDPVNANDNDLPF